MEHFLEPSRHTQLNKETWNPFPFSFCKLLELLLSDHTENVNIYTQTGELSHATWPVCSLTSSLFSFRKCSVFSVVLPTGARVPIPSRGDLSLSPSCSPVGQCKGDGAGFHLAGRMTACYFAGAGKRSQGRDK